MKICFPSVSHANGQPFIFFYDEKANTAKCFLQLAGTENTDDYATRLSSLKNIEGITITGENEVTIEDVKKFTQSHPYMPICSVSHGTFFRHVRKERPSILSMSGKTEGEVETQHLNASGIMVEALITREKRPGEWGNTLSYLNYFHEKTKIDESSRTKDCILGASDLMKDFQYQKNKKLYVIKEAQITIIAYVFNELLNPTYIKINGNKPVPNNLASYLVKAIENCMLNERLNCGPTPSERLSKEEREEKYQDEKEYLFAVKQEQIARVNIMLRPLLFFIDSEMAATELTNDNEIAHSLELLKQQLTPEVLDDLKGCIKELRSQTIKAGADQYTFHQLAETLRSQIESRPSNFGQFYSCYHLVHQALERHKIKEDNLAKLAEEITLNAMASVAKIATTQEAKAHIGKLFPNADKDFYLSKIWSELLAKELDVLLDSKVKKKLSDEISKCITAFVERHLAEMTEHSMDEPIHSNSNSGLGI
ncbi:hypothetical protein [Legionella jordanis]|uniref:Uncharacterized protein n=1 Tax=Legionella jordanis TaxID=456 RepID=A0A0W0VB84_9GAMM|nr:hypothetical protein [Legionella jordanis]KTD17165.1 hypothetical protein Ljor_1471 [Legionella jordanis]RMX03288.1 hypothetical protein EAW55_07665 [Legionella jordanis]VEH12637.1 Uncharacterised protein [Legionella jordanis]HAT8713289.1 hypothetical protein [Legionella jordanis]